MPDHQSTPTDYDRLFAGRVAAGLSSNDAAVVAANVYLEGKPRLRGKRKISTAERERAFWSSGFLHTLPADAWRREALVLALSRYFAQSHADSPGFVDHLATLAPETVKRAIRYSSLVLRGPPPRRAEADRLARIHPGEFGDFVRVLDLMGNAYRERLVAVHALQRPLAGLSPLDLLVYASLYAFEHLIPCDLSLPRQPADLDTRTAVVWDAVNDILIWKLGSSDDRTLRLTEADIANSLAHHLSPFLFPSRDGPPPREDLYRGFQQLLAAQMELSSFISRSADAFCYNDDIAYVFSGDRLEIVVLDPRGHAVWERNSDRLARLHYYWFYRGIDAFAASDLANVTIGRPENHEANHFAYIKALGTYLQLNEAYGLAEAVTTDSGLKVDLFQALLSMELMSAFYNADFMRPYMAHLAQTPHPHEALGRLAFGGLLLPDMQNRFPITWSDRAEKIARITGWTVSQDSPTGSTKAAEAILDFWTSDWGAISTRLRAGEAGIDPRLFERPVLKMGRYLFQLPWMVAMQNNASAAINNLRRIGARRREAREETLRIEERLAKLFEDRGFSVVRNYEPQSVPGDAPGEVDLICARDGRVLVLEIKSTFVRRSIKEAWLHRTHNLRKAGLQLQRKLKAVESAIDSGPDLARSLGLEGGKSPSHVHGWIVDTSIEHDHQRFSGYLKVSIGEVIIALRDDRHLLNDPAGLIRAAKGGVSEPCPPISQGEQTLYPDGFSFFRFLDIIESEAVWEQPKPV